MSNPTTKSATPELLFPAFIYGEKTPCRRKMKAEAKKWAKRYVEGREFPEPKLMPIPPGTVVFTEQDTAYMVGWGYHFIPNADTVIIDGEAAKQAGQHIQWRVYLLDDLQTETRLATKQEHEQRFVYRRAFMLFLCRYSWGALSMATRGTLFNSIAFSVFWIEALLRFWEPLDTLRYIDLQSYPMSLSKMLERYLVGQVGMWVERPTGNLRKDLQTALERMGQASPAEVHTRLVERLREMAGTEPDLKQRDWLQSPGVAERGLEIIRQQGQEYYDDMTSGAAGELTSFLHYLDRNHGPGSEGFDPSFGAAST